MRFNVISLFPEMFAAISEYGITSRAFGQGLVSMKAWQLRDFADNAYKTVDDRPYGGGAGMVMKPEPLQKAILAAKADQEAALSIKAQANSKTAVVYLSASGRKLTQSQVIDYSKYSAMTLICGRYEGIDQRIIDLYVDDCISLGDFVVSGGELPAMMMMDAIIRHLPGVIEMDSVAIESFSIPLKSATKPTKSDYNDGSHFSVGLLEYPHYTRPEEFEGLKVPEVLLSGNHAKIEDWRYRQALAVTKKFRPDIL